MNDNIKKFMVATSKNLDALLTSKIDDLSDKSSEYIENTEKLKKDAQKRFESFYGRKKWIDYLIIANLTLTPLILAFIVYWTFFKK